MGLDVTIMGEKLCSIESEPGAKTPVDLFEAKQERAALTTGMCLCRIHALEV